MKNISHNIRNTLLAAAAVIAVTAGVTSAGFFLGKTEIFAVFNILVQLLAVLLLFLRKGRDIKNSAKLRGFELKNIVYMAMLIFGVNELLNTLTGSLLSHCIVIEEHRLPVSGIGNVFTLLLLAPVFEELFFRFGVIGYMRSGNGMNKGIFFSVIASSLYAAVSHSCDIQHLPAILFTAVMLSIVYIYTENILYTAAIHFILNLTMFIPFGTYSYINGFATADLPHTIASAVLAVLGLVFFLGYFRPRFITKTYKPELEVISL